jgi:hypothetical protein
MSKGKMGAQGEEDGKHFYLIRVQACAKNDSQQHMDSYSCTSSVKIYGGDEHFIDL